MDQAIALINAIPKLFSYFVPGYVFWLIKTRTNDEEKKDSFDILLLSIVVTFIINMVMGCLPFINSIQNIETKNIIAIFIAIIGAIAYSFTVNTGFVRKVKIKLGIRGTSYSDMWSFIFHHSAWASVYLDGENVVYVGKVRHITCDPDGHEKELYLTNYTLYSINTDNTPRTPLANYSESELNGVYINCNDVKRIEFYDDELRAEYK